MNLPRKTDGYSGKIRVNGKKVVSAKTQIEVVHSSLLICSCSNLTSEETHTLAQKVGPHTVMEYDNQSKPFLLHHHV
jgi:hypothetical protein